MGTVSSAVVAVWAWGLLRDTGGILLDRTPESSDLPDEIRRAVESDGDSLVTDLHLCKSARENSPPSSASWPTSQSPQMLTTPYSANTRNWFTSPSKCSSERSTNSRRRRRVERGRSMKHPLRVGDEADAAAAL